MTNTFENAQRTVLALAPTEYYEKSYRHGEPHYLPDVIKIVEEGIENQKRANKTEEFEGFDVLDLGPGWGTMSLWLSRAGFKVTMMDLIPKGVWVTDELLRMTGAKFIQGDIFEDVLIGKVKILGVKIGEHIKAKAEIKRFPLVIMTQVMAHLKRRADRAIENVVRMMTDEGILVIAELDFAAGKYGSAYGTDWKKVPTDPPGCPEMNVVGFMKETLEEVLSIYFEDVEVKSSATGIDMIATARRPIRPKQGGTS